MSDLGLNEQHSDIVGKYLTFTKLQRTQNLKNVDCLFQDVVDSRLLESSYTVDEVTEILEGLRTLMQGEVESSLMSASHMNVLLLQQLCAQAQRWHLTLEANMSELENSSLLEKVRQLEKEGVSAVHRPSNGDEDEGPAVLLQREISRLNKQVLEMQEQSLALNSQLNEEKELHQELNSALKELEMMRVEDKQKIRVLELEVARLCDVASAAICNEQEQSKHSNVGTSDEELKQTKASLQQVKAMLQLAEKELEKKCSETAAFINLRRMLDTKNEQLRELRSRLAELEPKDQEPEEDE